MAIFASTIFLFLLVLLPETSRAIVGNGSIPSAKWNQPLISYLRKKTRTIDYEDTSHVSRPEKVKKIHISPWTSLKLFGDKETCFLLVYGGMIYACQYIVVANMPVQLQSNYGLSTVEVSLCYLATGFGTITSVLITGRLLDWNFRRHATRLGIEISNQKQQDLRGFPIELARLQITMPVLTFGAVTLLAYGWTMQVRTSLAAPLVFLCLQSFGTASSYSALNNLLMDLNREKPGTASAAMNLCRCWMGAGGVALGGLLNDVGGPGYVVLLIVGFWLVFSPLLVFVVRYGPAWRSQKSSSAI